MPIGPNWNRLTLPSDKLIDVNMEHVIYMLRGDATTSLYFSGTFTNPLNAVFIDVKETPDEIDLAHAVRASRFNEQGTS
jgi:hypothetical protein